MDILRITITIRLILFMILWVVCVFSCDLSANGTSWSTVRTFAASTGVKIVFFSKLVVLFVPSSVASEEACSPKSSGLALVILGGRVVALLIGKFCCGASVDGIGGGVCFFLNRFRNVERCIQCCAHDKISAQKLVGGLSGAGFDRGFTFGEG